VKYLLGADGGNSKTDYILATEDGEFVDIIRSGSCSHEYRNMGFDGMETAMREQLNTLFTKHKLTVSDISSAAFGLAGADLPFQIDELEKRLHNIGFDKFALANDGILGVKAVSKAGVCAINGSGTVVVGINDVGRIFQVGGIGPLSGDFAGGYHIAREVITAVYAAAFRDGKPTNMTEPVFKLLGIKHKYDLPFAISTYRFDAEKAKDFIKIADEAANKRDKAAVSILTSVGENCAQGVMGCIKELSFAGIVTVVKAGSIWNVIRSHVMEQAFESYCDCSYSNSLCHILLKSPPAIGALFWAKELNGDTVTSEYRDKIRNFLTTEKYAELIKTY